MDMRTFSMLRQSASADLMMRGAEPYGDSVRLRKLGPPPQHLYLIYVTMDDDGLVVRHLEKDIDPAQVDAEEMNLIDDAILGRNILATNFDTIVFKGPSFFTIILDEAAWEFYYPDPSTSELTFPETHDPILFTSEKAYIDSSSGTPVRLSRPAHRNLAFYNLEPIVKTIDGNARNGVRCINFFTRNHDGDPVGDNETLYYSFNILLRIPFSRTAVDKKITIIIDPDGQNQGPITLAGEDRAIAAYRDPAEKLAQVEEFLKAELA